MSNESSGRDERQKKAAAMRAAAAQAQARRRMLVVASTVLATLAVAVAVFVLVATNRHTSTANQGLTPTGFTSTNGVTVGQAGAPVTLVAYEDFQCPNCRNFEQSNKAQLDAYVRAGTLKIEYRPIAFLDRSSSTEYSTRALNAFAAVVTSKPSAADAFHTLLFTNQPAEDTAGLTNARLIALAVQAGAPQAAITTAITNEDYKGWTVRVTDASSKAGITGTPDLSVNGTKVPDYSPTSVKAAIDAAATAK